MKIENFKNGEKITQKDWVLIDKFVEKNELSLEEAIDLREFDKFDAEKLDDFEKEKKQEKKEKDKTKKGITEQEVIDLFNNVIKIAFKDKTFQNKDFHKLVSDIYTNRQTPSRLKKLKELGYLEDLGGSPKQYKIKD